MQAIVPCTRSPLFCNNADYVFLAGPQSAAHAQATGRRTQKTLPLPVSWSAGESTQTSPP